MIERAYKKRWEFSAGQEYPLHSASATGNRDLFDHFLKQGHDLTATDDKGDTPLHCAATEGQLEIIQYIVSHVGVNSCLNLLNPRGVTPLTLACAEGQLDCAIELLKVDGCEVNHVAERSSALHEAVAAEYVDCVRLLIDAECDVDKTNEFGETALHVALRDLRTWRCGQVLSLETIECIKLLVDAGRADIDAKFMGATALHVAVEARCVELVTFLLQFGSRTSLKDASGRRAIDYVEESHIIHQMITEFDGLDEIDGPNATQSTVNGHDDSYLSSYEDLFDDYDDNDGSSTYLAQSAGSVSDHSEVSVETTSSAASRTSPGHLQDISRTSPASPATDEDEVADEFEDEAEEEVEEEEEELTGDEWIEMMMERDPTWRERAYAMPMPSPPRMVYSHDYQQDYQQEENGEDENDYQWNDFECDCFDCWVFIIIIIYVWKNKMQFVFNSTDCHQILNDF